jgi:hypothetical protein
MRRTEMLPEIRKMRFEEVIVNPGHKEGLFNDISNSIGNFYVISCRF